MEVDHDQRNSYGILLLTAAYNTKNNIVYGVSRKSISRALLEAPMEKFPQSFLCGEQSVVVV